ncbi:MAG: hypothetical protein MK108_09965 [Mariniblastus sp.]|nr:hypothetical protein [Mariniblastus sp.]
MISTEPNSTGTEPDLLETEPLEPPVHRPRGRHVSRQGWLPGCLLIFLILSLCAAGLIWLALESAQQVPEFYAQALAAPIEDAVKQGDQLEIKISRVQNAARNQQPWQVKFTQGEVNGWLVADLPNKFPTVLPREMENPRVHFEPGKAKLAFQYSASGIDGIVVAECNIFCTGEQNQLAVQIISVKSGVVSLPIAPWMDRLSHSAEQAGIPVRWSSLGGNQVALISIPDKLLQFGDQKMVVIEAVQIRSGNIFISGTTTQTGLPGSDD